MKYISYLLLISFFSIALTDAQTLYWVGGSGNWNDQNHWSLQSGGNGGTLIPNKDIDVVFDDNSINSISLKICLTETVNCNSIFIETNKNLKFTELFKVNCKNLYSDNVIYQNFIDFENFTKYSKLIENNVDKTAFTISETHTNTCNGLCNGTITINIAGVTPQTYPVILKLYNSLLCPFATPCQTATIDNISTFFPFTFDNICGSGQAYSVRATDNEGSIKTINNIGIVDSSPMTILEDNISAPSCSYTCDGIIEIIAIDNASYPVTYNWSNADNTETANDLCANVSYIVTLTDDNNCTTEITYNPLVGPDEIILTMGFIDVTCNGFCNGTANVVASGGTTPYSYLWDDGGSSTSDNLSALCAGIYTVTVTDAQGCEKIGSVTISEPAASLTIVDIVVSNVQPCFGDANGSITFTITGGTTPYSYDYGAGQVVGTTINGLSGGTYNVTITDANECTAIANGVVVGEPAVHGISITDQTNILCNGDCNGTATSEMFGGTTPYTYLWDDLSTQTSGMAINLCAGVYNVIGTDAVGCTATTSVTITEPSIIDLVLSSTDPTCNGNCDGTAGVVVSGGTTPYTYSWCNTTTNPNVIGLCAQVCGITVTDANGCPKIDAVTITDPPVFGITMSQTNVTCFGACDGDATATPTGGNPPYTYAWSCGGQITQTANNLCAGICTVTVTDNNGAGCQSIASVTITQPTAVTANITSQTNVTCNGGIDGSATVTASGGSGGYTYNWSPNGFTGDGTVTYSNLSAGIYTVNISDGSGCPATTIPSVTITEPTAVTASITAQTNVTCNGGTDGSATVTAGGGSGGFTYDWSPNGFIGDGTVTYSTLSVGIYTVVVSDGSGCPATTIPSVTITEPTAVTASITAQTNVTCNGGTDGSATVTAGGGSGGYTYNWSPNGFTGDGTDTYSNLSVGIYSVIVSDGSGCPATTIPSVTITEPTAVTASITAQTNVTCNGDSDGSATVTAGGGSGGYTYNWSPNGFTGDGTVTYSNLSAGIYTVVVSDGSGCLATTTPSVTITEPTAVTASITAQTNVSCNGGIDGSATVTAGGGSGGYTYDWSPNGFIGDGTVTYSTLSAGIYTVVVSDGSGCPATTTPSVTITEPTAVTASITAQTNVTCNGGTDGSATVTAVGGSGGYTYNWSPNGFTGDGTVTYSNLSVGIYTVVVSDGSGCPATTIPSVTITEPTAVTASITAQTNVTCNGGTDGSATVTAGGGSGGYTYDWSPNGFTGDGTDTYSNLSVGIYSVIVSDGSGCPATTTPSVTITEPIAVTASITAQTNISCNGGTNGSATVTAGGGSGGYTYDWSPNGFTGEGTVTYSNLSTGIYIVNISDGSGCPATTTPSVTITEPASMSLSMAITDETCTGNCDGEVDLTVLGGNIPYTFLWGGGQTSEDLTLQCSGPVCVTVTDATFCTITLCDNVTSNSFLMPPTFTVTDVTCAGGNDGAIDVTVVGGNPPITYQWLDGPTTEDRTNLVAGTYCVTITDGLGICTFDTCLVVNDGYTIDLVIAKTDVTCNGNCDGTATVTPSGGTTPYIYLWDAGIPPNNSTTFGLCVGIVNLTVTDANSCSNTGSANIGTPTALDLSFTTTVPTCSGSCDATAKAVVSGGTSPYTYLWDAGGATGSQTNIDLCAGVYNVTVTDASSCTVTDAVTIVDPAGISVNFTNVQQILCSSLPTVVAGQTFLPDGSGVSYETKITHTDFAPGQTITSTSDIESLCMNMEHSYMGDLAISLTCPNGSQLNIISNAGNQGGGTIIGNPIATNLPVDGSFGITPGIGMDYCWSPTSTNGRIDDNVNWQFLSTYTDNEGNVSFNIEQLVSGTYQTEGLWNSLIGCPINGDWTITVTDNYGADNGYIFSWQLNFDPSTFPNGYCTGEITADGSGGNAPYTYQWSNGSTSQTISDLCAGTYCVTITGTDGCTSSDCVTISEPPAPLTTSVLTQNNVSCNGMCNASVTLDVTGGTSPYTYKWDDNQTTNPAINLCDGIYNCTVYDANLCEEYITVTITEPATLPTASIASQTNASCAGVCNGSATTTCIGGTSPYTYLWSASASSQATATASNLCAGVHSCTVTDNNGCTSVTSVTITNTGGPVASITAQTNVSCNGGTNGSATVTVVGGSVPFNYNWSGTLTDTPSSFLTTNTVNSVPAGVHSVIVTDNNTCTSTVSVTITQPNALTANITAQTNVSCKSGNNGTATLTVSGGTTPYTYLWSNGETTNPAITMLTGVHTGTVTDANGCKATVSVTITEPALALTSSTIQTDILCNGDATGSATVTPVGGTSPYTYDWSPSGPPFTGEFTNTYSNLTAGIYSVDIKDANNCSTTSSVTITENSLIVINGSTIDASCGVCNGEIEITVSGGVSPYSFNWSSGHITDDLILLCAGSYTITVTDAVGCIQTATFVISNVGGPTVSIDDWGDASCFGACDGWANASAVGGTTPYSYQWSGGQTTLNIIDLCAGVHTLTVTDANSCLGLASVTIDEPSQIVINFIQTNVSCKGSCNGSAIAVVSGGTSPYLYSWTGGSTASSINGLCAGVYDVTVTDSNNCSNTESVTITEPDAIVVNIDSQTDALCNTSCDGNAELEITGGTTPYTIIWCNGETSLSAVSLCAGNCDVTITDGNACGANTTVTISAPTAIIITPTIIDANCGACDGSIDLTVSGGTSPYTFLWSTGSTLEDLINLCSGSYTVTVTDDNGCTSILTININDIGGPSVDLSDFGNCSCFGVCDGWVDPVVTGGVTPYTYLWSSGDSNLSQSGLCAGVYTINVTGANGCIGVQSVTITEPTEIDITFTQTNDSCNGSCDGSATALVSGGTSPYTYLWSNGFTTTTINNLCAGVYDVTVTDVNLCSNTASVTITEPNIIIGSIILQSDVSCFSDCDGSATISVSGGTSPYDIEWCNGDNGNFASNLCAGICDITITDSNLCTASSSVIITEPSVIDITYTKIDANCGASNGSIDLTVTGGTTPYSFVWSNGATTEDISGLIADSYTVTVTDGNGCTATLTIDINDIGGPTVTIDDFGDGTCFNSCDGFINVTVTGGVTPYTLSWSGPGGYTSATEDISGLCAGVYTITATGSNGCISVSSVTITPPTDLDITFNQTNVACNGNCDGTATAVVSGGTSPYTYLWYNGTTVNNVSDLCAGVYSLTVTDSNGCSKTSAVTITQSSTIAVNIISQTEPLCYGDANGKATINVSGGSIPYIINWCTGESGLTANILPAGDCIVTITDASSCSTTKTITTTQPDDFTVSIVVTNATCGNSDGEIDLTVSGATSPYTFNWSSSENTEDISGKPAGLYSVTITDANSCDTIISNIPIINLNGPVITTDNVTDVTCFGLCDGEIYVSVSGGVTPYTYNWSNSDITDDIIDLCAGIYSLTVIGADGCQSFASYTITEPAQLDVTISKTDVLCNGDCTGEIILTISGGTTPYNYLWSDGQVTSTISNLCVGNYCVTITDANNCTLDTCINITEPALPLSVVTSQIDVTCFGMCDASATVTASGGTTPYIYLWNDGQTTWTATILCAGVYTCTITDANGCSTTTSVTITQPADGVTATIISQTNVSCYGVCDGKATVAGSGGTTPYTYLWNGGSPANEATDSLLCAQAYAVTVTDQNGCEGYASVTITEPDSLYATSTQTDVSCNGGTNGSIDVTTFGGTTPYTYIWNNGFTTEDLNNLSAGTYCGTVTDANGCTFSGCVTINENSAINASVQSQTDATCNGDCNGTATLSINGGTSPYSYIWSNGETVLPIDSLCSGISSVTITDFVGCQTTFNVTINEPDAMIITPTVTDATCLVANGAASVSVTGGITPYSYQWSNPPGDSDNEINNVFSGTYTITVNDANSCEAILALNIDDSNGPTTSISSFISPSCNGDFNGSATVSASGGSGGYSYDWSPDTPPYIGQGTATYSNLNAGIYSVVVHDSNNCQGGTTITITEPAILTLSFTSVNVTCNGLNNGSSSAIVSGGTSPYSYTWDAGGQTSATATNLSAGVYNLTVTDSKNCEILGSVTITEPALLTASINTQTNIDCNSNCNGSATSTVNGGTSPYIYLWDAGTGNQNTAIASSLCDGSYSLVVSDQNGCTANTSVIITEPAPIIISANVTNSHCTLSDGSATVTISGGVSPYTYLWSSSEPTDNIANKPAGTYTVTVTDSNGCISVLTIAITDIDGPTTLITSITNPSCNGICNGSATVTASGGNAPYTYTWSNGNNISTATSLCDGVYSVTVTDASGCKGVTVVTITSPNNIDISFAIVNATRFGACNGSATTIVSGGTGPYTYQWDATALNQITSSISNLCANTYTITVTDINGCNSVATVTITSPPQLLPNLTIQNNVTCNNTCNGSVTVIASGGTPPYNYEWDDNAANQTTQTASNLCAGVYTITITDNAFDTAELTVTITEPTAIDIIPLVVNSTCGNQDGSISISVSGGVSPYTFAWSTGDVTSSINNIPSGAYTISVTDANDCMEIMTIPVSDSDGPTATITGFNNPNCYNGTDGDATVIGGGIHIPFDYKWDAGTLNQTTPTAINLADGIYSVTVTDTLNCKGIASVTITEPSQINITFNKRNLKCNGVCDGIARANVSGGTPTYTYLWSNSLTTNTLFNLCAGNYIVTVTDANACSSTASVSITQPAILTSSITSQNNLKCFNSCIGNATVTAAGGTLPYSYIWNTSPNQLTTTAVNLCGFNYSVTVTDQKNCSSISDVTITEPLQIDITESVVNSTCINSDGEICLTVNGGTPDYSIIWNNGTSSICLFNISSNTYEVTVTDQNSCTNNKLITVSDIDGPTATITDQNNPNCFNSCDGDATVEASGGVSPYTYLWDVVAHNQDTLFADSLCDGTYSVTVFDANLCKGITSVTITAPDSIIITETHTNVSCFGLSDGAIDITVSGGSSPYTFLWSNGETTEDINNLPIGIYCVTVTDANTCSNTACYTITEPANALTLGFSSVNLTCYNSNDGAIDLTISGGTTPYTVIWSNGSTTEDLSALAEGNYCVTVTDANGCSLTDCISITMPDDILITLDVVNSHCNQSDGCITATVTGGTTPYSYNWSAPNTTSSLCDTTFGSYILTVTDANNCQATSLGLISDIDAGTILFSNIVNVLCNGQCNGSVSATLTGSSSLMDSYIWSNGDNTEIADTLCVGIAILTVTTDAGCGVVDTVNITEPLPLGFNFNISNVSCFNGNNGSISLNVSGGTSPYTYSWSDGSSSASLSNLIAGTYSVTVTDANGCTISDATTITQPATELTSSISGINVLCNGGNSGTGTVVAAGGTSPYTYLWSSSETTSTATMLIAGWNYVSPTDASGCQIVDSIQLSEPSALVLSVINVVNSHCTLSDGSATIIVSGGTQPYSYLWDEDQITSTVDTLHSGIYMPTVTDLLGCQDSIQVNISDQDAGTIAFTNVVHNACYGDTLGTATASITGGTPTYIYNWVNINQTDSIAINLGAGVYTVSIIDASTCISIANITITQPPAMQLTFTTTNITCYGSNNGSIDLTVSGGAAPYTYEWSNGFTTEDISGLSQGTYLVTVTDANGCKYDSSATITQPDSALTTSVQVTNVLCNGGATGAIDLTVSGGTSPFTYLWSNAAVTEDLISVIANSYSVTITDANSCITTASATISEPVILNGTFDVTEANCGSCNGSAFFNVSGGTLPHTYKWSTNETTNTINNLCVNFYFLTVTDANLCTYSSFVEINDTSNVHVNTSQTNVTCNGNCDATATAIATGGTSPYTYLWDDLQAQTTATAINLCDSTYVVIAEDSLHCKDAEIVIIPDVLALDANLTVTNIACNGQTNGSISTSIAGGTAPYTITWGDGSTGTSINSLSAGTYYITVRDVNNCELNDSATVIEPAILTANISNFSDLMCYGICSGTATAEGIGGTSPFTYLWSNADTTALADSLCANIYDVTITDSRGCFNSTSIAINQPQQLTASFTDSTQVSCNGGNEGTATITPVGGTSPYTYLWNDSNGQIGSTAINLYAGIYTVSTTDFNGCTISNWIEIVDTSNLNPTLSVTQISCFGMCDGSMTVLPSGGTPPYSYIWIPDGETTITISDKCAGEFGVTVYDANMCSRVRFDTLIEPSELSATIMQSGLITCHDSCNGEATISPIGGSAPYTFIWNNLQTDSIAINLCNGTYKATVTDSRNCSFELPDSVIITAPTLLSYDTIVSPATCEQGTNDGAINLTITGGVTPYSILWSNNSTTQSISSILSGYYDVSVTDALGCKFNIDSIFVNPQIILTPDAGIDTSVCFGDSIMLTGSGGIGYLWDHGATLSDSLISNPLASPSETTEYILTVYKSECSASDTVTLTVLALPNIDAGLDVEMYFFETITLNATSYDNNITSYLWRPNINITDTTIYYPTVNPETSTVYIVYATNTDGCVNSDSVLVSVIPYITFPTGFTPNGDGKNDVWEIGFLDYYPQIEVSVYNRWGEELFYSKGYQTPWDGTFNGKNMPVGTYYYLIKLNIEEEKKPITGPITIIR